MKRTYRFRLYPNKEQKKIIEQTLSICRDLYNNSLAERRDKWEENKTSVNYYDQANKLRSSKQNNPFLSNVHSQVLQDVLRRVDKAFNNFFRRIKNGEKPGYPRFKGRNRYDSFAYPQSGFEIKDNRLILSKIGSIKIKMHREIPEGANIKTCTIRRDVEQWHACFSVEIPDNPIPKKEINKVIGIDLGLNKIATLSNGEKIENPRWLRESEKKLAKEQRRLSKKKKKSKNRGRQRIKVAKVHRKIRNQRRDFHHKLSRQLVNNYDLTVFEDLNVKGMVRNPYLAKSINDAGWEQLTRFTSYKAEEAGSIVDFVNPNSTTQECCICGNKMHLSLAQRVFRCPNCGNIRDRDENSAINIRNRGLEKVYISGTGRRACLSSPIGDTMIQEAISTC